MSDFILHLDPAVEADVVAAAGYYADIDPDLAVGFADELEHALTRVQSHPMVGRTLRGVYRRMALERFPYMVVYLVEDQHVRVVAIEHVRRDPESILRRARHRAH